MEKSEVSIDELMLIFDIYLRADSPFDGNISGIFERIVAFSNGVKR